MVLGDVDGDGDLDLVVGFSAYFGLGQQNRLYQNDGRGVFTDVTATHMPSILDPTRAVVLGDIDGDGDLDLVVGNGNLGMASQNRVYRNDGAGVFADVTASQLPSVSDHTTDVALGDVDGDGDLDLVVGNAEFYNGAQNRLYLNHGGTFSDATASNLPVDTDHTNAVALGDIDADGDLDLVLGNGYPSYASQNRVYTNDGTGVFTDVTVSQLPVDADYTLALALGDVDGDGDVDIVCGNNWDYADRLYLNDGAGQFSDVTATAMPGSPVFGAPTTSLALGDLDGDGDLDLLQATEAFATPICSPDTLLLNSGNSGFTYTARIPATFRCSTAVTLGDVDGDGDLDAVWGVSGAGAELQVNLLRQLDAPAAPIVGQSYQLDVYARYGAPRLFDVALPYLSLAPASVAVPGLGTIGIDLAQAAPLDPLLIAQPAGVASTSFMVPNNAALVGLELFAQAARVPFPLPVRLTNATRGVVQ